MKVSQQEIVVAARELFRTQGYAGASMPDLADRVGLKKASLYSRFPDKETLVGAVLQLTLDETFAGVDNADNWLSAYEKALGSMADTLMDKGRCVAFHLAYGASAGTPKALEAVRGFFTACRHRFAEILSAATDPEDADRIADAADPRLSDGGSLLPPRPPARPVGGDSGVPGVRRIRALLLLHAPGRERR